MDPIRICLVVALGATPARTKPRVMVRSMSVPRLSVLVLAISISLTSCGFLSSPEVAPPTAKSPVVPTPAGLESFYNQEVVWRNCGDADCATIIVPVDYADPKGPTTKLAITKVKANGESIGSLFVNPGGPGGSAFDYAKAADYIVSPDIRDNYDIVGVDPRGVVHSSPITCLTDQQRDEILEVDGTPDNPAEEQLVIEVAAQIGQSCKEKGGALFAHMGTVEAARDLDIARALVNDPVLNYLGKSYGSGIGIVYSQLFPANVGRMVLDGVLPPDLTLEQVSKEQAEAFEVAVDDFAADCVTQSDCPFVGDGPSVADQLRAWLQELDSKPIRLGERILNEPVASYALLSYLYFPPSDYAKLRPALSAAVADGNAKPLFELLDARISRGIDGRYLDNSTEAFYAVICLDRPFLGDQVKVQQLAKDWKVLAPTFGAAQAWGLLTCANWPAKSAEQPPVVRANLAPPMLIVSTKHDPATPYQWGEQLANQLGNARLLTWDRHQHTGYTNGSECIDAAVDTFWLSGELPAAGVVCD